MVFLVRRARIINQPNKLEKPEKPDKLDEQDKPNKPDKPEKRCFALVCIADEIAA